jgi:hypothetical protein
LEATLIEIDGRSHRVREVTVGLVALHACDLSAQPSDDLVKRVFDPAQLDGL